MMNPFRVFNVLIKQGVALRLQVVRQRRRRYKHISRLVRFEVS